MEGETSPQSIISASSGGGILPPKDREALRLVGMGATDSEIARRLNLARSTVKNRLSNTYTLFGVKSRTQAVLTALDQGELTLAEMVPSDYDFKNFSRLNTSQLRILRKLTLERVSGWDSLSANLNLARNTIKNNVGTIEHILGVSSQAQAAVLYRAYLPQADRLQEQASLLSDQQHEILRLIGMGLNRSQIAHKLVLTTPTIKGKLSDIYQRLDVHSETQAVLTALDKGELALEEMIPVEFDFKRFLTLRENQLKILNLLTAKDTNGVYPTSQVDLAATTFYTRPTIKNILSDIYFKLGVFSQAQAAVLYRAFKPQADRLQEEARVEAARRKEQEPLLNSKQREMLRLSGLGLSTKEIARRFNLASSTINNDFGAIFGLLGVQTRTQAVLTALDKGELKLEEMVPQGYDFKQLLSLNDNQRALLETLISKDENGHYPNSKVDLAAKSHCNRAHVKNMLTTIYIKSGAYSRPQLAILYRAFKPQEERLREEMRIEVSRQGLLGQRLNNKQREIVKLIGQGLQGGQIADRLNLAQSTIKNKISEIFKKLHARDRTELIISAIERGELLARELLPEDADPEDVESLPQNLKDTLQKMVENHGSNSREEIARQLNIEPSTLKNRISMIYEYLGLSGPGSYIAAAVAYLASQEQNKTQV